MASQPETGLPLLSVGGHADPDDGACLMEYVSVLAGETFSDHPRCTDRLLAYLARLVNDETSAASRSGLARLAPELIGTVGGDARTHEAMVETCFRVARGHGAARLTRSRIPLLARGRIAHARGVEHAVHALRRLPTEHQRDAALHDLLAAATAACQHPPAARAGHPARSQRGTTAGTLQPSRTAHPD